MTVTTRARAHLSDFENSPASKLTPLERETADALIRLVPWARHAALDEYGRNADTSSHAKVREAVRMGVGV